MNEHASELGKLGGNAVLKKYGMIHYKKMAEISNQKQKEKYSKEDFAKRMAHAREKRWNKEGE